MDTLLLLSAPASVCAWLLLTSSFFSISFTSSSEGTGHIRPYLFPCAHSIMSSHQYMQIMELPSQHIFSSGLQLRNTFAAFII